MNISIVITTYNRPDALKLVLQAFHAQAEMIHEIIIADDGSNDDTKQVLEKFIPESSLSIKHIWQTDQGFQAAKIRNKAVAAATGDYIIFVDGDVVPRIDFIHLHAQLAEHGYLVAGNRILLSAKYTQQVLVGNKAIYKYDFLKWCGLRLMRKINRLLPLLRLPLTIWRKKYLNKWQGVKTCNLAVWRDDFIAVNGCDENFQGWGYEDSDLVVRLFHYGIKRKDGRYAVPVLHLWHTENDRSHERENWQRFEFVLNSNKIKADKGIDQYL